MVTFETLDREIEEKMDGLHPLSRIHYIQIVANGHGTLKERLHHNLSLFRNPPGNKLQDRDTKNRIRVLNETNDYVQDNEVYIKLNGPIEAWESFPEPYTPNEYYAIERLKQRTMTQEEYRSLQMGEVPKSRF